MDFSAETASAGNASARYSSEANGTRPCRLALSNTGDGTLRVSVGNGPGSPTASDKFAGGCAAALPKSEAKHLRRSGLRSRSCAGHSTAYWGCCPSSAAATASGDVSEGCGRQVCVIH